jgi:ABC-2 type transport system permease protein
MGFQTIKPTLTLAVALGVGLLAIDCLAWRAVSALFDRERLITGVRHDNAAPSRPPVPTP